MWARSLQALPTVWGAVRVAYGGYDRRPLLVVLRWAATDTGESLRGGRMTAFTFDGRFTRSPVALSSWPGYISPNIRERIKQTLETGCYCTHDQPRTATLVQRNGGVWLQCDACGSSVGTAMKRADHQKADAYPHWRPTLVTHYDQVAAEWRAQAAKDRAERTAEFATLGATEEDRAARRAEYEVWCRTSPEWSAIKKLILWRSRGHCEACLSGNAQVVHHLTYGFGKLPPAWHLRAVCTSCHGRLHDGDDDWCDFGMARG
jgi:transcription elongation factor Elf1